MPDIDHLAELFAPLGGVTFRRMFSGYGIMKSGAMFALISRDELYFKTDDELADRFRAEGSRQWKPTMRGKPRPMPYWRVPDRLYDEPEEFAEWARSAFTIAAAGKKAKGKPKKAKAGGRPAAKKPASRRGAARTPTRQKKTAPKRR